MLEHGICTLSELRAAAACDQMTRKSCFIGLYPEATHLDAISDSKLSELVLRGFATYNRTFKRTSWARTVNFDNGVLEALRPHIGLNATHVVQDLGVSDARNSCDFFAAYAKVVGISPEFFATDLCFTVLVIRRRRTRTRVVIDKQGHVLQVVFPPFVLPARIGMRRCLRQPLNVFLRFVLLNTSVRKALQLYSKDDQSVETTTVSLICSEAQRLATATPNFHFEEHNALEKASRNFTTVRAVNLFNPSYFSDAQLSRAISNVLNSLSEGGAFIVGSNGDSGSTVNGAAYLKHQRKFDRLFISGKGCEIEPLILKSYVS